MESTITATELARTLGDVLSKIWHRRESFVIEWNGTPIARLIPLDTGEQTLSDGVVAWTTAAPHDPGFGDDLERVNAADRLPANPWDSESTPSGHPRPGKSRTRSPSTKSKS